ncbi:MAG: polymerase, sigma-24 subunit, subfamily [Acidimicrobiales bacterium]|nr:polymerase, sigma-24 subunit, subfamily [Acidimicrobiales bacterium]
MHDDEGSTATAVPAAARRVDHSDGELAAGLRARSQDELAEAYRRHSGVVFGYARALLGQRDAAERVTQDVFVTLWRQPAAFDPDREPLRAHLLDLVHRLAARSAGPACAVSAARPDPGDARRPLDVLPPAEGRALDVTLFGRHSYREAARVLAQPEAEITRRIRDGLRRLHGAQHA